MPFSTHVIYRLGFRIWRKRRLKLFLRLIQPGESDVMLDVGGYPWFWAAEHVILTRIDALNRHEVPWSRERAPNKNIRILVGDGCCLAMPDNSYDIGFSNSVIEHLGTWEHQQQFASEIRRVARTLWVQTPAYECPVEPHYLAPLVHYLPRFVRKRIARWVTPWGWIERPNKSQVDEMVDTTRLLKKSEMQQLFPDCEIITERLLWIIPKSYIAIRKSSRSAPPAE